MNEQSTDSAGKGLESRLRNQSDHDLLIMHAVRIDTMCSLIEEMGGKIDKYSEKIDSRCETRVTEIYDKIETSTNSIIPENTFRWVIGILIFAMISMVAVVGVNQVSINANRQKISMNKEHVNDLRKEFEKVEIRIEKYHMKDLLYN